MSSTETFVDFEEELSAFEVGYALEERFWVMHLRRGWLIPFLYNCPSII